MQIIPNMAGASTGRIIQNDSSKRLPCVFVDALKPIFTRLTNEDILQRCLKGFTQNQNESLNGTVWNRCPKTRFCGQQRVQVAVCEAVCQFNAGSGSVIELLSSLGSELSGNTYRSLHQEDKRRLHEAARKILKACLIQRKNCAK